MSGRLVFRALGKNLSKLFLLLFIRPCRDVARISVKEYKLVIWVVQALFGGFCFSIVLEGLGIYWIIYRPLQL